MDTWAKGTSQDREALFTQTASATGISPEIVEKDFWVCWILYQVFQLRDLPRLMFKGGTSLSKAFAIIKRFSEDIDLVLNRHELGFNAENDPANQQGSNLRDRTIEKLKTTCRDVIAGEFMPKLDLQIRSIIGDGGWSLALDPNAPDGDTIEFTYPKGLPESPSVEYIKHTVRLELGCRGDQMPWEQRQVKPYAAEAFPEQFEVGSTTVDVISVERTFWEKATILHREYYRAEAGKPPSERVFRHYDDVLVISRHERGAAAIRDGALLEQVASHKQHFFREAAARYDLAKKATIRLTPNPKFRDALKQDYERMREMYFGEAPDFDTVMNGIRELEKAINEG
jgi:hypothetical protein